MSNLTLPGVGRIWEKAEAISLPGRPVLPKHTGIVAAALRRPLWSIKGVIPPLPETLRPDLEYAHVDRRIWDVTLQRWRYLSPSQWAQREALAPYRDQVDPKLFAAEVIWVSVTHNERVNMGGAISVNALFGTVGTTPNGVFIATAIATTGYTTTTASNLSIGSASANVTTNEFTTIGLSRASSTVQNYVAASALNGTYAVDIFRSFSVTGSGTAHGAAIFDSTTVSGSHLYCEDIYASDAVCVSGDTLQNTWTVNN